MLINTSPTVSRFLGQPLTDEDAHTSFFLCEVGNVIASIEDGLEYSLPQLAEAFEIDEGDYIREKSARQQLLRQATSFLLQRPVADHEVIRENMLDFKTVDTFFYRYQRNAVLINSSSGEKTNRNESAELERLRKDNERLQLEVQSLRREKKIVEEQAIASMRYRPSNRNNRHFASLDEYIGNMLKNAVAEGVREVIGEGKANV